MDILAAQPPDTPTNIVKFVADQVSITVVWKAPSYTGGSPITNYNIYWDAGTGTISYDTVLETTSWQTLIFTKSGLTTNTHYRFAVSASNVVGESLTVESAQILTATIPGQP